MKEMIHSWAQPSKNYMAFFRKEQLLTKPFWKLCFILWEPRKDVINTSFFIYKMMMEVGTQIIKIQPPSQQWLLNLRFLIDLLLQPDCVRLSLSHTLLHPGLLSVLQICKVFFNFELHTGCSLCPEWFFLWLIT